MADSTPYQMPPVELGPTSAMDWGYGRLLGLLARRRVWFISVLVTAIAGAVGLTLITPPLYESSMQLLVQSNYQAKSSNNKNDFADPNVKVDSATQLKVLLTSEILQKAVDRISAQYPDITVEEIREVLVLTPLYASTTNSKQQIETNVWQASYQSNDPNQAQNVLEAILSVYQVYNLEQQELRLSKGLAFINEQLPEVRKSLVAAESALQNFRRRKGVIDPAEQAKVAAAELNKVKSERQALGAQIQETSEGVSYIKQKLQSPDAVRFSARLRESQTYQNLLKQKQEKDQQLASQQQTFTENHPNRIQVEGESQALQAQVNQERNRVLGQATTSAESQAPLQGQLSSSDFELTRQLTKLQETLAGLQARDQSLAQTETQLQTELAQYPKLIAQYNRLQPEVATRRQTLQKLLEARQDLGLEIARGGADWKVVEAPELGEQIGPSVKRNLLLGAVVGLFLGGVAAFAREALDDTLHSFEELGNQVPLPLLGMIPDLTQTEAKEAILPLPFHQGAAPLLTTPELFQWQPLRESLDLAYTNIQLLKLEVPPKSLMVTSALAGEGKSTITLGLAISAARQDQRVLLIDADLRQPTLHTLLHLNNQQGLSTLLTSTLSATELKSIPQWAYLRWEEQLHGETHEHLLPPSDLNLDVLTSGPLAADPVKLLSQERMRDVIATFERSYDLILIDCPPVLGLVDTIPVGLSCDGVIMVARMDCVKQAELSKAISMLEKLNLVGLIANGVQRTALSYANYRSYSYARN